MPQIVNGCGTWYYGKKNVQQYQGVCRTCKNTTTLTSYDTRLYVVVVMIPIIPLGRRRIIEECAACTHHGAMPLADWQRAQKRADESIAAFRAKPNDTELAKEALGAVAAYRNLPAFLSLAPEIEKQLANDAKMLCMVGAGYDLFGRIGDTERLYRAAYEVVDDKDEDEVCELLADCLLRQGKPQEAEPFLSHIVEKGVPDRVDALYALAQAWQVKGNHDKAMAAFDQCEAVNPLIKNDATFARLRDESAKRLGTSVVVKPTEVVNMAKRAEAWRKTMKVGPVVLALALLGYVGLAYLLGSRREVTLVNGVDKSYTVKINGVPHVLSPGLGPAVRVGEGDIKVEIVDPPGGVETAQVVSVHTPFLTRPFRSHDFVLNPDGAALIQRMRVYYAPEGRQASQPQLAYSAGQLLHRFDGVDHAFENPPDSISLSSSSKEESRDVLSLGDVGHQLPRSYMLLALTDDLGKDTATRVAQRRLAFAPDEREYLLLIGKTMAPADAAAFLKTGLAARPVRMEWHRAYQRILEKSGQTEQLEREYDAMLAGEPANKELMYLAGRASRDVDKELALINKAADGDDRCPHALFSLSAYRLAMGEFAQAAAYAHLTLEKLKDQGDINYYCRRALIAGGQLKDVLELARAEEAKPPPMCIPAFSDQVYAYTLLGERDKAEDVFTRLAMKFKPFGQSVVMEQTNQIGAQRAYVTGKVVDFVNLMKTSSDPEDRVAAHLTTADVAAAERDFGQVSVTHARPHLLMFLAASLERQPDIAAKHLDAAVKQLSEGETEDRAFAAALKAPPGATKSADLLRLRGEPDDKAILLAAMGVHDPASREAYFEMARKLNYDKRFPHLLINRVLDARPTEAPRAATH